ncbi:MFS transporter [Angustibacter sp. McL0619]|uniref:MFS transporter n=1 Tax=Angustibacter sp. McL0619 TaxID=3415676 RepID=UPI003CF865A1
MAPTRQRWLVLAVGLFAQTAASSLVYGMPFLVPALRDQEGLSLARAGLLVSAPIAGLLVSLIAWGALADRYGERVVMASGLVVAVVSSSVVGLADLGVRGSAVGLFVAGVGGASVNAASGRLVMGWFPRDQRGLAMGIRQTAQPLGVAIAAAALPTLAKDVGVSRSLLFPASLCALAAVLVVTLAADPARTPLDPTAAKPLSPYREPVLWRLHTASALLVLPQFAIAAFSVEYLVRRQDWPVAAAGGFVAVLQVCGAVGRIGTGVWSDRVGSRLRPMRQLAVASAAVMLVVAAGDQWSSWLAVAGLAVGAVVTVADNGLAFTATAEIAGSQWAGRALGIQNTAQNVVASAAPPLLGALVGASGYAVGFGAVALFPLAAIVVTPVAAEAHRLRAAEREPVGVSGPPARP